MKTILISLLFVTTLFSVDTIYKYNVKSISGGNINFADYKGKKILIVNTASKCGNTPQYEGLEKLYEKYKEQLVIVGFPANNFMGQEPGSNEEIAAFCQKNYGVSFPIASKVSVKGRRMAPIYEYLIEQAKKKNMDNPVTWNFGKFLIDEKGELIATFSPKTQPLSPDILKYLK
ncbi:MAG TPA: glutathione peroxidase [Niabella sp.]|nr:glutathione peroxidase [Niabella sp.]HOZ96439.1 glutathione peroxidase [Niabella sp.]HQW13381.1 glutathione peroxidase [Niabella sp.]HQX18579.1 glutathione peroxidase [Niabella sp.]HRB06476.1 glutathione peroxidase [Niabella sp.]